MLLEQIKNYEIFRPKCDFTKENLHAIAIFDADISPAFPEKRNGLPHCLKDSSGRAIAIRNGC